MAKRVRTDCHRVSEIVPADYGYVMTFSGATTCDGVPMPPVLVREACEIYREHGAKINPGIFSCDVCGAEFIYGDLWRHAPTGEIISLGWECAEKYEGLAERGEWEREKASVWAAAERAARLAATEAARAETFAAHPGLAEAFETAHYIVSDIAARFERWGSISGAQIALVFKIAREEREREAEKIEKAARAEFAVPIPAAMFEGRHEISGTIRVAYWKESERYGSSLKMIVEVPTEGEHFFTLWGTCAAAIHESKPVPEGGYGSTCWSPGELKGAEVTFAAAVEKSDTDEKFGFIKRPTKARMIKPAEASAA